MKFLIAPESSGYSPTFGEETLHVKLDGGAGRTRRDILNSSIMLDCSWILDLNEYNYMTAFYRSVAKKGAIPFEIDLVIDTGELTERTAKFMPGTFKLAEQRGLGYFVSATLEVFPEPEDEEADLAIVEAYNEAFD